MPCILNIAFVKSLLYYEKLKVERNVRGALWHIIQTFVGSLLIIVTALVIKFRVKAGHDPQAVLEAAHDLISKRFGFFFATIQVEQRCLDEQGAESIDVSPDLSHEQ